jgi:hypothetical protein
LTFAQFVFYLHGGEYLSLLRIAKRSPEQECRLAELDVAETQNG